MDFLFFVELLVTNYSGFQTTHWKKSTQNVFCSCGKVSFRKYIKSKSIYYDFVTRTFLNCISSLSFSFLFVTFLNLLLFFLLNEDNKFEMFFITRIYSFYFLFRTLFFNSFQNVDTEWLSFLSGCSIEGY